VKQEVQGIIKFIDIDIYSIPVLHAFHLLIIIIIAILILLKALLEMKIIKKKK